MRLFLCLLLLLTVSARAAVLDRAALARRFPAPLVVGEKAADLPAWPLFKQNGTATELVGYAFESAALAPVPGFAGVPPNLLVVIDARGSFLDVALLSQHEPVFLDGLGEAPLHQFLRQYAGLSLAQGIDVVPAHAARDARRDPSRLAHIREDVFEPLTLQQMLDTGLLRHLRVSNREAERLFAGSEGAGLDPDALAQPDQAFVDLYLAWVSVPSAGRNLLAPRSWTRLRARLEPGDHALLVLGAGRYRLMDEDFVRGSVPQRILLRQDRLPVGMRDLDLDLQLADGLRLPVTEMMALRVIAQAGLDPARPLDFALPLTRSKGIVYPERIVRELSFTYRLPAAYFLAPPDGARSWQASWRDRRIELAVLSASLVLLAVGLLLLRRLVARPARFAWLRRGWLLFVVGFIGYAAQAQLSIVNITGVLQALREGRGLGFLLFDPMTVLLWGFVLISLLLWGRGAFCGWLCPFGALQEFAGAAGRLLRVPQLAVRRRFDARLKHLKFVLLAAILLAAVFAPTLADKLVEAEPFKTAITLNFVRAWPYVLYAGGLLALGMAVYKFFCRYLCPFGAALALLGRIRLLDWIPRRAECGTPCQTCRHRCAYNAIAPSGKVDYGECFQCLDCVAIHDSDALCAPRILERKRARTIPIVPMHETSIKRRG